MQYKKHKYDNESWYDPSLNNIIDNSNKDAIRVKHVSDMRDATYTVYDFCIAYKVLDNGNKIVFGISFRNSMYDQYCKRTGRNIAINRMLNEPIEMTLEEFMYWYDTYIPFSGKVISTESYMKRGLNFYHMSKKVIARIAFNYFCNEDYNSERRVNYFNN